jgi:hypothetical protein
MVVPLLAIPLFAIVGVPQFASHVVSADADFVESWNTRGSGATRSATTPVTPGRAAITDKAGVGESARHSVDELFAPYSDGQNLSNTEMSLEREPQRNVGRNDSATRSNFAGQTSPRSARSDDANVVLAGLPDRGLPAEALEGYATARDGRSTGRGVATMPRNDNQSTARNGFASNSPHTEPTSAPLRRFDREPGFTWDQAVQRLKGLGIQKYHLESLAADGGFSFRCSYSAPDNPRVTRRFESEAPEPLAAVRIVLEQIEAWRAEP